MVNKIIKRNTLSKPWKAFQDVNYHFKYKLSTFCLPAHQLQWLQTDVISSTSDFP